MNEVSIFDLVEYFPNLSQGQAALIDQVYPYAAHSSDASDKCYFRKIIQCTKESKELFEINNASREAKLSDASIFHKDRTDMLCLKSAINDFVGDSVHRSNIFGKY